MTATELVLVISCVINVISVFLIFSMFSSIQLMKLYISQLHTGMSSILSRLVAMEGALNKIGNGFGEFVDMFGNMMQQMDGARNVQFGQVYRTMDGKYTAASLEELISKIKNDNVEKQYFSDDELKKLRQMFEADDDGSFEEDDN